MRIDVQNVTKKFGSKIALNDISFSLEEPKIYGLLGRNGAGKTTFMDILAGYQLPSHGTVHINGETTFDNRNNLQHICLIKEANNFFKDVTVKQVLKSYRLFYPHWDQELAMSLINAYQLPMKSRMKSLSKGMASALGVVVGLASRASITVFDEPYIGMDAAARKKFYDILMEEYEAYPRTIIFSTHLIDEVSLLFEEVLIIRDGTLILQEKAEKLREHTYAVTGEVTEVKKFICNKQVMKTKQLANVMTAYVYGEKQTTKEGDLTFEGIPIQDVMIYLTENQKEVS